MVATALDATKKGGRWTHYAGQEIHRRFQEAVVDYYKAFDLEYKSENVIPTAGSSAALFIARARVMHPPKNQLKGPVSARAKK